MDRGRGVLMGRMNHAINPDLKHAHIIVEVLPWCIEKIYEAQLFMEDPTTAEEFQVCILLGCPRGSSRELGVATGRPDDDGLSRII